MVELETARQLALSFPGTVEKDHFGIPSFRTNDRIFATLWIHHNRMMVKLPPIDQSVFHSFDPAIFYPAPNKFGHKGATFVELENVRIEMLEDALNLSYQAVMEKKKKKR